MCHQANCYFKLWYQPTVSVRISKWTWTGQVERYIVRSYNLMYWDFMLCIHSFIHSAILLCFYY